MTYSEIGGLMIFMAIVILICIVACDRSER